MRATVNLGMICMTLAFCAFLKYFAGPMALQKEQEEFILNMMMLGGRPDLRSQPPHHAQKIRYRLEVPKSSIPWAGWNDSESDSPWPES